MNLIFSKILGDGLQTECAIICKKILPQLLLARSKNEKDVSINKTVFRKRQVDEFMFFDKKMESGKYGMHLR